MQSFPPGSSFYGHTKTHIGISGYPAKSRFARSKLDVCPPKKETTPQLFLGLIFAASFPLSFYSFLFFNFAVRSADQLPSANHL